MDNENQEITEEIIEENDSSAEESETEVTIEVITMEDFDIPEFTTMGLGVSGVAIIISVAVASMLRLLKSV